MLYAVVMLDLKKRGKMVREARRGMGYSQPTLAKKADTSLSFVQKLEGGAEDSAKGGDQLRLVGEVLGIPFAKLRVPDLDETGQENSDRNASPQSDEIPAADPSVSQDNEKLTPQGKSWDGNEKAVSDSANQDGEGGSLNDGPIAEPGKGIMVRGEVDAGGVGEPLVETYNEAQDDGFKIIPVKAEPGRFALLIRGNSMADEFKAGEYIVCDELWKYNAKPGNLLVVTCDGDSGLGATFKRLKEIEGAGEDAVWILEPINKTLFAIRVSVRLIKSVKKVVGKYTSYDDPPAAGQSPAPRPSTTPGDGPRFNRGPSRTVQSPDSKAAEGVVDRAEARAARELEKKRKKR